MVDLAAVDVVPQTEAALIAQENDEDGSTIRATMGGAYLDRTAMFARLAGGMFCVKLTLSGGASEHATARVGRVAGQEQVYFVLAERDV